MLNNNNIKSVIFSFALFASFGFSQEFSASLTASGGSSEYVMTFGFNPSATDAYDGDFDMYAPPAPPPPAFDAALMWGGDRYYTQILAGDGDLSVHEYDISLAYGSDNLITMTWDNTGFSDMMSSCVLQDAFGGAFVSIDLITGEGFANPAFASWDGSTLSIFSTAVTSLKLLVTPTDYSPPSVPTVTITSPEDGSTIGSGDFSIEYSTTDFTIGSAGCSDCDGHVHVFVDGSANAYGDYMVYAEGPISLSGVPNGDHSIMVQLVDPSHQAFDPSVESTVNVSVSIDVDDPPMVGDIPDQSVASGESFTSFDLDDYLTELDGDDVAWSYEIEGQEPEPGFTATIYASGGSSTYDLNFGFHPDATDAYDADFDMYAPPAPPPPAFDAALMWGGDRYYTQILAFDGDNSEHEYDIALAYGSDNMIDLSWDNTGWSDLMSSCILQDAFGGLLGIDIDMLAETSLSLTNPAFTSLKLKVTPLPEAIQTRGIMVDIDGDNVATVTYDDGWMGSETVIFTATDQTADMLSDSDEATFTVTEGAMNEAPVAGFSWSADNLMVTFTNTSSDADGDALSFGWDFGDGDTSADENPTHTYASAGTYEVSLTANDGELNDTATQSVTVSEEEPPSEDIEFTATMNGTGGTSSYDVTWGVHPDATDAYDAGVDMYAPPAPPPPSFDLAISWLGDRYYTQIIGSTTNEVEYGIVLQYADDNLINLTWDNSGWSSVMSSCNLEDAFGGDMINVDMLSENSLVLDNPAFTALKLFFTPRAPIQGPDVSFSADPTTGYSPLTVAFTNMTTAGDTTITGYSWDFGDGGMSTEENPTYTYENSGMYSVSLTATDDNGIMVTETMIDYINVMEPVVITADFSGAPTVGMPPLPVEFTDMSVPSTGFELTSWAWDFGDGGTSTDQNPSYTYEALGEYTVSLTVSDDSGSSTETKEGYIRVVDIEPGDPDFALTLRADGPIFGYDLIFGFSPDATDDYDEMYDLYAPPPPPPPAFDAALMWNGDRYFTQILNGSVDDLEEHEYSIALAYDSDGIIEFTWDNTNWGVLGSFTLIDPFGGVFVNVDMSAENSLTVDNPAITSLLLRVTPTGVSQPTADFSAENTSGYPPLTVNFMDESVIGSSDIVAWSWDFGDGNMGDEQNPSHAYESDGMYSVSLTITDVTGLMDTEIKTNFVTVIPFSGPTAAFSADNTAGFPPLTVNFMDESTTDPGYEITSWEWNLGDGTTSTDQNPSHVYDEGVYTVSLTVTDENGLTSELVMPGYITALFEDLWPPSNLSANAQQNESGVDVHLEWDAPQDPNNITINWDNGENNDGIGLTNGGEWKYAARWDASDIIGYDGYFLNSVYFFPRGVSTTFTLNVWMGANAGILLYEQAVNDPVNEQWNEVVLDSPVQIDASDELWIGFSLNQPAGEFPAGCDSGPAVPFYGDMLTLDGMNWESMATSYGLNFNWNIQGTLSAENRGTEIGNNPIILGNTTTSTEFSHTKEQPIINGHLGQPENSLLVDLDTRDFQHYNVYRDGAEIGTALDEMYDDMNVPDGVYEYYVTAQYDGGESVPTNTVTVTVYFDPNVVIVDMYILLDDFPGETTWDLVDENGNMIDSGGPYTGGEVNASWPLSSGDYVWTIYDSFGDGICCAWGEGLYELSMFGEVFASGGEFASEDVVPFNVPVLIFGTISGTVYDQETNQLSGVNIDLDGNSLGETGDDGSYSFEAPVGLHTVTASLMGYIDDTETGVEIFDDQTTTVDFFLTAYPVVSVSGHVTGWDEPDGLSGATVTLTGYVDYGAITDTNGDFDITGVYGDHTYNLRISKEGYQTYNEQLDIGDTDVNVGTIDMPEFTEPLWPPDNLQATVSQQTDVHLTWNPPVDPAAIELFYDDGTYENHWYVSNPPSSTNHLAVGFTYPEDCILNTGKFEMSFDPGATDFDWNVLGGNASAPDANDVLASGTANLTGDPNGSWYFIDFGGIEIEANQWFYLSVQYRDGQTPGSDVYYCGGDATANDPYSWYTVDGFSWSNLQGVTDLMIRALISTEFVNSMVLDPMPSTPNPEATIMQAAAQPQLDEQILAKITSILTADPQITSPITRDLLGYNVYRDNAMIDFVVPTEAWDNDLADGTYTYFVTAQYDGGESEPSNSVTVTIEYVDVGLVIIDLDPTPTGEIIRDALDDIYPGGVMVATSLDEYDLIGMDAVFVLLGIFSNNTVITPDAAQPLLDYIDSGGNLYMEGSDMWYYDPQFQGGYDFGPEFGITALADGSADLSQVVGQGFLEGFEWNYSGENNWIDQIDPANDDAFTIFRNDQVGYNCGVAYDPGDYKTIGSSFEIAGLGGNSSLEDALDGIIDFFEIGEPPGFIEGMVTLNGGMGDVSDVMISTDDDDVTYANNDGSYSLAVQAGTYTVTAHLVGYADDVAAGVTVNSEQTVNVDFTLNAIPTIAVFGQVVEFGTGTPLSGATVTLTGYADFGAITAPNGNFNIEGVFSGQTYDVEVAYGNLETFFTTINVGANDYNMGVIELSEFVYPPTDLSAQVVNFNDVVLNWHSPTGEEPPPPGGDGDTIEDAMIVTEIPFMDTQNTNEFSDDYDEECPYTGSTSSDVVYMWMADAGDYYLSICDSDYDTKIYVYDENLTNIGCVDDSCEDPSGNPWRSDLNLTISSGTYYVIVDGYGGQNGIYNLSIDEGTMVRDIEIYQPPKPEFDENSVENNTRDRELLGYNIYRNGSMIEEVFTDTLYVDNNVPNGFHIYGVRAVYTSGISDAITVEVVVDAPLVADFQGTPTDGFAPLNVQFADLSLDFGTPIVAWFWEFGDGGTSNMQNPSYTYTMQGSYDVSLMILDMSGTSAQETKYDYINVMSEPGPGEFINSLTATGDDITYAMNFGFAANATDGFDPGIDLYAPPAPPPPSFDAALGWGGDRYYTQILAVDIGVEKEYTILLQYPVDNTIVLNWDNTGWSGLGTFILIDPFGGVMVNEDMTQINSITLTNPALTSLYLRVTAGDGPPPGDTDDIALMSNWNLMSFDVDIENNEPADVFASLIADGNLVYVTGFGESGATFFDPNGPGFLNTLTSIDAGAGYWVKVNNSATLTTAGMEISPNFSTDIFGGWNILGYWLDGNMAPEDAFTDLIADGNLVYVTGFGEDGATFFDPNGPGFLNTLTALENGYGYWVKVNNDVPGFQYPAGNGFSARQVALNVNPEIIKTNEFMFVNGTVSFDHIDYFIGDKVSVETQDGILIGEMEILEYGNLMTTAVYGDDNTTSTKDGADNGESLVFIYGEFESQPVSVEFTANMELRKVDLLFQNLPQEFGLTQNFPNPFNPVTTIQYMVPEAADVQLVVYDLMGKTVRTLVNGSQSAGYKTIVWDSKDESGIPVSAGMYIYELRSGSFSAIQKMVLLK